MVRTYCWPGFSSDSPFRGNWHPLSARPLESALILTRHLWSGICEAMSFPPGYYLEKLHHHHALLATSIPDTILFWTVRNFAEQLASHMTWNSRTAIPEARQFFEKEPEKVLDRLVTAYADERSMLARYLIKHKGLPEERIFIIPFRWVGSGRAWKHLRERGIGVAEPRGMIPGHHRLGEQKARWIEPALRAIERNLPDGRKLLELHERGEADIQAARELISYYADRPGPALDVLIRRVPRPVSFARRAAELLVRDSGVPRY